MDLKALAQTIEKNIEEAEKHAASIARGVGGREVALVITKLQEALHWTQQAQQVKEKAAPTS